MREKQRNCNAKPYSITSCFTIDYEKLQVIDNVRIDALFECSLARTQNHSAIRHVWLQAQSNIIEALTIVQNATIVCSKEQRRSCEIFVTFLTC